MSFTHEKNEFGRNIRPEGKPGQYHGLDIYGLVDDNRRFVEYRSWKFNRRNINKIAWEYDAEVKDFNLAAGAAFLIDDYGRALFVHRRL